MSDGYRSRVAFVCVQNAGRSQMAYAFAQRQRAKHELDDEISLRTGGTRPADAIHPEVIEAMSEIGISLSGQKPREIPFDELQACNLVITMGCSATDICPVGWGGESRDWALADPDGRPIGDVREIRDEIELRVSTLFAELSRNVRSDRRD